MKILFCCEFYFPSVGGVQEVMRQIAERLVQFGHDVTVATTKLPVRQGNLHNGVRIVEFDCVGNHVYGIRGEVEKYREFVVREKWDAVLIKAAQQWTFDALWSVIDDIKARKVFIPCGFSGLYRPDFKAYFEEIPAVLRKFDTLIFYASEYRDVNFARQHGINAFEIIPNGACEREFSVPVDSGFREKIGVPENSFVFLTVGSQTGYKGHLELLEAFAKMKAGGRHLTLVLNGNIPTIGDTSVSNVASAEAEQYASLRRRLKRWRQRTKKAIKSELRAAFDRAIETIADAIGTSALLRYHSNPYLRWIRAIAKQPNKLLVRCDLNRIDLVQAYKSSDLFVFASNVEYSPLVLFEAAASATPFLSVPVGNSEEIANWLGCGIICPAEKDPQGCTRVAPEAFALAMEACMNDPIGLRELGARGRRSWEENFTWGRIARLYESAMQGEGLATPANEVNKSSQ